MNMSEQAIYLEVIKEKVTAFVYPLSMGGDINKKAFDDLVDYLDKLTKLYQYSDMICKNILYEIYSTAIGISCENEYYKNKELDDMYNLIMKYFGLLISGKTIDDVTSAKPRII